MAVLMKTLGYIQAYILTNNAFPTHAEQQTFLHELIKKYPHANDVTDLMSRVSIFLIALLSGEYLGICLTYPNYLHNIQYKRAMSKRGANAKSMYRTISRRYFMTGASTAQARSATQISKTQGPKLWLTWHETIGSSGSHQYSNWTIRARSCEIIANQ